MVEPNLLVSEAVALMHHTTASCLLVIDQQHLLGLFTAEDVIRVAASGYTLNTTRVITAIKPQAPAFLYQVKGLYKIRPAIGDISPLSELFPTSKHVGQKQSNLLSRQETKIDSSSDLEVSYLQDLWQFMHHNSIDYLPVFNDSNEATGLITQLMLLQVLADKATAQNAATQNQPIALGHSLFENSVEGIFQTTPDGNYLSVNSTLAQIHGYESPQEMITCINSIGQQLYVSATRRDEFVKLIETHKIVQGFEAQVYRKDGSIIWVSENGWIVQDEHGKVLYYEGTSVDISDRKRIETERQQTEETLQQLNSELESCIYQRTIELEKTVQQLQREVANRQSIEELLLQNEAQFQRLAATVPGMLFQYIQYPDGSDRLTYISPSCQDLYDVSPEQGLESTQFMWEKIYLDDVQALLDDLARAAQRQEPCYIEYRITPSSNCIKWLAVNARPERQIDGSILWHGIAVDITKRKQIEEALQHSEERFRTLFNESPFGIALVDMENKFIQVNPAYCQLIGRDEQEFLQMSFGDFTHPDDLTLDFQLMQQLIEQSIPKFQLKKRFFKKNGELFWANLTVVPIYNPEGKMLYTLGTIQDITDQTRAEEVIKRSEEQLRLVLQNMPVMLDVFDRTGKIIVWNQECERVTGYSAAEIIGNPNALAMLYPDSNYLQSMLLQWVERGPNFRNWEWDITCKDGSVKTIAWSNLAQEFPVVGWESWAIGIDVSDRKKAETEMLNALNQERELNELKSQFITTVSHEFRTPLSTILASTELLERYDHQWSEEKRQLRYQRIIEAIARMTHLLNDVLFVGKAEAKKLEFNPNRIDVLNFCHELIEELNLSLKEKHTLKFVYEGNSNTILDIDIQLLRHILYNLVSNAIKYSPNGGEISIKLICQEQKAFFQIQDTGIGIDPEDQEHLFTLFKRGKNVGTILGTGLGLTIVKRCVELHGGNIAIESELGVGTLVNITLPSRQ